MSPNEIQCFDEEGRPKCHYYSIVRYGRLCSFDGTWNPSKINCPNFIPIYSWKKNEKIKACYNCIWRNYKGSMMGCDNIMAKVEMQTNPKFITPCEWFELDKTGEDYLIRIKEGIEFLRKEV